MLKQQIGKALYELDKVLAFIVLFASLGLTIWLAVVVKQPIYTIASLLVFIVCAAYLLLRKRLPQVEASPSAQAGASSSLYLVLNIAFFALLTYSIISFHLRPELYIRPLEYFISTALMATVVGIEILFLPQGKYRTYFALFKIILIALSLRWLQVLIFPDVVGSDPWAHQWFTTKMLIKGHIPEDFAYSKLPLMHLLSGATSLTAGLNYKMATMFSVSSMQVICDSVFVFLLARLVFGERVNWANKVGLLTALLLGVANHHIYMGYIGIPNTMGATLILPIIYLLLTKNKSPRINTLLALLLMAALIMTHTVAAMCLLILLFVFWVGFRIYNSLRHQEALLPVSLSIVSLFAVGAFGWWMYVSGHILAFAQMISLMFTLPPGVDIPMILGLAPLSEQLFAYTGILLFFAFSFMGLFYMVSKFGDKHSFVVAIGSGVIFGVTAFAMFGGRADVIIGHRWIYFSQILLAIPLATTLLLLYKAFNWNLIKVAMPAALVLALPFFMIISPPANMENRTFFPTSLARGAFTESELQGIETTLDNWGGKIGGDYYIGVPIAYSLNEHKSEFVDITKRLNEGNFRDYHDIIILIRDEIVEHAFIAYYGIERLDYDPRPVLAQQGFSKIYDCGSVSGFIRSR